jgi:general secretion pathway protein C
MLQDRLNFWLIVISLVFLSYSTAVFVSSFSLLKLNPCVSINLSFSSPPKLPAVSSPYIEKEGFFKSPVKTEKSEPEKKEEVIINLKNFVLKGTIVCSQCDHSIVILKDTKTGKTITVSEGKEIEGFKVLKVYPDYVLLSRNGREYVLRLFKKEEAGGKGMSAVKSPSTNVFKVRRKEVIEEISSGKFLKYINITPSTKPEGLKVNYVSRRSFIYKLGIRPGDIITAINDIHLKTPEDSFSAFEQLKNSDSITIKVVRRGKEVKLHYELE